MTIAFAKVRVKVPRGQTVGKVGIGLLCVERAKIRARTGRFPVDEELFNDIFREKLTNHNYTVVGDPDALFQDRSIDRAQYFVTGLVKDYQVNACFPMWAWGDTERGTGSAYMKVEWQVYETSTRKVVYKTTTEGSAKQGESVDGPVDLVVGDSFGMATQNLLADKGFHELVTGKAKAAIPATTGARDLFKVEKLRRSQSDAFDAVEMRPGVVIVRPAIGHGSGFFISSDGFLLTNQHVVGDATNVRIVLHSGREVPGEFLRTSSNPDVALVKVGGIGYVPLPLRFDEPKIGSEVLVYGAPLSEGLEGTLTRGIVSAYRNFRHSGNLIQSDVVVQGGNSGGPMMDANGNVIAITMSGREQHGVATGHNFSSPLPRRSRRSIWSVRTRAPGPSPFPLHGAWATLAETDGNPRRRAWDRRSR